MIPLGFVLVCLFGGGSHDGQIDDAQIDLRSPEGARHIAGGSPTIDDEWSQTVALRAHLQRCSGVMVSETIALTAAHCVADLEFGQTLSVFTGTEAGAEGLAQGIRWGTHPNFCLGCGDRDFDYGFVELFQPYEPPVGFAEPVVTQAEWDELMRPGTEIDVIGYGATHEDDTGPQVRRHVELRINSVAESGIEFNAGGDGRGACGGDSGGPAFARREDGSLALVGLFNGSYGCGNASVFAAPYPSLCWLRDETGVDLVPPSCESCDCLDVGGSGCSCRAGSGGSGGFGWTILLIIAGRRAASRIARRRRGRRAPSTWPRGTSSSIAARNSASDPTSGYCGRSVTPRLALDAAVARVLLGGPPEYLGCRAARDIRDIRDERIEHEHEHEHERGRGDVQPTRFVDWR